MRTDKNLSMFDFLSQMFILFGLQVAMLMILTTLFGEEAGKISSMFQLGGKGIAIETLLQYAGLAVLVNILKYVCMSNLIFKKMLVLWRTVIMLILVFAALVCSIIMFRWFPADEKVAWILFVVSFGCCFAGSFLVMILKTKLESKKYGKLLAEFQEKDKGE